MSCADCLHQFANAQNPHHAFHVVGQDMQRHFGADVLERFHLEMRRSHPRLYRAEGMLHSLGQNRKSSMRAYVFRFAPESGRRATWSTCPFRAMSGHGGARGIKEKVARKVFADLLKPLLDVHFARTADGSAKFTGTMATTRVPVQALACRRAPGAIPTPTRLMPKGLSPRSTKRWSTINDRRTQFTEIVCRANCPARG